MRSRKRTESIGCCGIKAGTQRLSWECGKWGGYQTVSGILSIQDSKRFGEFSADEHT